jgi:hypothetical protein
MKTFGGSGRSIQVDDMNRASSNDVIRTGSIKSSASLNHKVPLEVEPPASPPNQLSSLRKHRCADFENALRTCSDGNCRPAGAPQIWTRRVLMPHAPPCQWCRGGQL